MFDVKRVWPPGWMMLNDFKQEAICSLHSGCKQLESTRNPETRANLHQKVQKRLTPRHSQPRKRFTKACSNDDAIAKRLRVLVPSSRAALQSRHDEKEPVGRP